MMEQIWKPVKGFEGYYLVSNLGNIRRSIKHFQSGCKSGNRVLCPDKKGYLVVILSVNCKTYRRLVARLVTEVFVMNPDKLKQVNHINGCKQDNRSKNLEWVSDRQNKDHGIEHGLYSHGEMHCHAKLDDQKVREIRKLYNEGYSQQILAAHFNVHRGTIAPIIQGRTWKRVI